MRRLIFFLVIGGLGLAALMSLGIWQLQRLAWKEEILATIDARIQDAPVALPADANEARDKYLPVAIGGEILPGELLVVTSRKGQGPGFRVIAPFLLEDGRRILIDRGFVPSAEERKERSLGSFELEGNLHWPQEVDSYTPAPELDKNIWYARDVTPMAAALEAEPLMVILREAPEGSHVTPMPVSTSGIANDHLQYAITWFSLALIWALMTGSFLWRSRAKSEG